MEPDINLFSLNRELFPRNNSQQGTTNRLICGHLNRIKFKPDIEVYLDNRKKKVPQAKSLARASRCLCHQVQTLNSVKNKIEIIYETIEERKLLSNKLERVTINIQDVDASYHKNRNKMTDQQLTNIKSMKKLCRIGRL